MPDADLAAVARLIADPARAEILRALMAGRALTAGELARLARLTPPAASNHLSKLLDGGLIEVQAAGRHRYYGLSGPEVAAALEALALVSPDRPILTLRASAAVTALRPARLCYDHLAGELGVQIFDELCARHALVLDDGLITLTAAGVEWFAAAGVDTAALSSPRRPLLRSCLDGTERRFHLAGSAAAALATAWLEAKWIERRSAGERGLRITECGAPRLARLLLHQ